MKKNSWLPPAAVILATLAAFAPTLQNDFQAIFDDDSNFLLNPYYRGFAWPNLKWMLTAVHNGHYHPLTWLSCALDYALWGMDARGYHLTSLLLHAGTALLFYQVALRLFEKARPGFGQPAYRLAAAFAALLFAVHPLRVESVAWASERRDVLSGFFFLGTVLFYLDRRPGWSLLCYSLSLLSKGIGVTMPAVLLILDAYPLRRLPGDPRTWSSATARTVLTEKLPFIGLALAAAAVGFSAEVPLGAADTLAQYAAGERLAVASYGLASYLWKTLWPAALLPLYPKPHVIDPLAWPFVACLAVIVGLTAVFALLRRRFPAGLAAWAYYAATLVPVLGLVRFGPQLAADRYTYLPCLGLALLAGGALLSQGRRALIPAALVLLALSALTWRQTGLWRDSPTLWTYVADADAGHAIARNYLGNMSLGRGDFQAAAGFYRAAIGIDPGYAAAHNNLANVLASRGRLEEAVREFREAIRLSPAHEGVHYNLANVLLAQGRLEEAAAEYREELRIDPGSARAQAGLEAALRQARP